MADWPWSLCCLFDSRGPGPDCTDVQTGHGPRWSEILSVNLIASIICGTLIIPAVASVCCIDFVIIAYSIFLDPDRAVQIYRCADLSGSSMIGNSINTIL